MRDCTVIHRHVNANVVIRKHQKETSLGGKRAENIQPPNNHARVKLLFTSVEIPKVIKEKKKRTLKALLSIPNESPHGNYRSEM